MTIHKMKAKSNHPKLAGKWIKLVIRVDVIAEMEIV